MPGQSAPERMKLAAKEWNLLSGEKKSEYEIQAEKIKENLVQKKKRFENHFKIPVLVKRNGYHLFVSNFVSEQPDEMDGKERISKAREMWKGLPESDKKHYARKAVEDLKR